MVTFPRSNRLSQRVSVIRLPSYRPLLQILLAILMMTGGAVDTLAMSLARIAAAGNATQQRVPLSEEDNSENEREGRVEELQAVERHRSDRRANSVHRFPARESIANRPVRSQRPIDLGRSPPVLC